MRKGYGFVLTTIACMLCMGASLLPSSVSLSDNFPGDADGYLIISQLRYRHTAAADFNLYSAQARFFSVTGDTATRDNVGMVTINDSVEVIFFPDSTYKIFGMDFSQDTSFTWKFDNTVNGVISPTNTFTTTKPLININNFDLANVDTNINRNSGFTFGHSSIQADSIIYIFSSDTARIQKKYVGSATGVSFSGPELLSLPVSNTGSLFVIIYNVMPGFVNGKKYYFQNNSVAIVTGIHVQ